MPINELEQHPFLYLGETIHSHRMIVGTYPIYSLTLPRTERKVELQTQRGDVSFFYGSTSNLFWEWYQNYIDPAVNIENAEAILNSLQNKEIGISDVIKECCRVDESFEDNKLRKKVWNKNLADKIESSVHKIICTSKSSSGAMGWLCDKILRPQGFVPNEIESSNLHQQILGAIPNSNTQVKPIARVLSKKDSKVSIVALPSPGSPERRLSDFGRNAILHTTNYYLNAYLTECFNWFMK